MPDRISREKRSEIMSRIHAQDTKPELMVRSYLHRLGYRFRKNYRKLPGAPDIYLKKYNTAIFINGCFWHAHEDCRYFRMPKSNIEFWKNKFAKNKERDKRKCDELHRLGIRTIIIWECEVKDSFEETMTRLDDTLKSNLRGGG